MNISSKKPFHKEILQLDAEKASDQITRMLRHSVLHDLKLRGAVVGLSGGIDSSVTLGLAARALGNDRVVGVILPERESSPRSKELARRAADTFHVKTVVVDITAALDGFGCYRSRDEAVAQAYPDYDPGRQKFRITLPQNILNEDILNFYVLTIVEPDGSEKKIRLPLNALLQIIAASNFKQRSRMAMLYYQAESRNYAVIGTSTQSEFEQGYFVKYGDAGTDIQPIVHLCKMQVYQLGHYLGVPDEIIQRTPTPDTYPASATAEEFFFQMPWELVDLLWYAWTHDHSCAEVAQVMNLTEEQVQRAYRNFGRKVRATKHLRESILKLNG